MTNINDAIDNDEVENEVVETPEAKEVAEAPAPAPEKPKSISLDDALVKAFEKHAPEASTKPKGALPNTPAPDPAAKPIDPVTGRVSEPIKAPAGWTPILREKWSTVDPTVQKFIHDREKEMAQNFTKSGDDRKLAQEVREAFSPYEATLRTFNVTGVQLAKDLMTQWHAMQTGSPQVKAQIMHNLITHFQPDIAHMVALSQGQRPAPAPQAQVDIDKLVEQKLAAREEQQTTARAERDIQAFASDPKNEFYDAVHDRMSKILQADLAEGSTLPELLKSAYDIACSQHPEVKQVIAMRTPAAAPPAPTPRPKPVATVKPSLGTGAKSPVLEPKRSTEEAVREAMRRHGIEA